MDCYVVEWNQSDHRPNALARIADSPSPPDGGCLTMWSVLRKALSTKRLGDAGRPCLGHVSVGDGLLDAGCCPVLESCHSNLVTYKWLKQVLRPIR